MVQSYVIMRLQCMWSFGWHLNVEGQGQTLKKPKNFEVEYFENGIRETP